jgi:hypothetical protein
MNDIATTRMLLTTAVLAAVAALIAAPANAVLLDVEGGGGSATTAPAPQIEPGTIPYLSHGIGVDASLFGGTGADTTPAPGTIPYLSHGIGVDASLFGGTGVGVEQSQASLGLTGDGALTRGEVFQASTGTTAKGSDVDWSWVGVGAGMAALLAAAMTGLYLSARRRSRVALP